jgi:predicted dehydrogenase
MHSLGIVGLGHLGEIHLKQWLNILGRECISVYDSSLERLNTIAAQYEVKTVSSYQELLDTCDIIDIVTPTHRHFELAEQAMLLSKHLFIEKPVCETLEQLDQLLAIQADKNNVVQIGFVERYNPAFTLIKDLIANPKFFEIHRLAPFNPRGTEVSVIMDLMIHDLDLLCYFEKSEVKSISATGVPVISKTPDIANVRIEFESGSVANVTSSRISMKRMRKMRVFCNNMYANLDFLERKSELYEILEPNSGRGIEFCNADGENKMLVNRSFEDDTSNAIHAELSDFLKHVKDSKINTLASLSSSRKSLSLALRIHQILNL